MKMEVFVLPIWRWNQVVDWLEKHDDPEAKSLAEGLVQQLNDQVGLDPEKGPQQILNLWTFAGYFPHKYAKAAIKATKPKPDRNHLLNCG